MTRARRSVCIGCGDGYQFTNRYKGNYCPDCHEEWSSRPAAADRPRPRPIPARSTASVRRVDDGDGDAPTRYEDE